MKENGFEYVDLGLPSGTMWATCNLGANKPEEPGLLFQWGRTDGYKNGDKNHKFRKAIQNCIDTGDLYIPQTKTGKLYKCDECDEILDLEDDAAYVNMGGKWRMPTKDQLDELYDNTTHEAVTINELQGMLFTSNINNKQFFVPFVGYWYDGNYSSGLLSCIWSSQVHPSDVDYAYILNCNLSGYADINSGSRSYAFSVRGVFNK